MTDDKDDRKVTTVQCFEDDKVVFNRAAKMLRWKLPLVMELLAEALVVMVAEEDSVEQRKERMLAKLGQTNPRQKSSKSLSPVSHESHNGAGLVEVAS